ESGCRGGCGGLLGIVGHRWQPEVLIGYRVRVDHLRIGDIRFGAIFVMIVPGMMFLSDTCLRQNRFIKNGWTDEKPITILLNPLYGGAHGILQ
ncbi:MAG TPA: hypothetical protein PLG66_10435, partial [Calditrichia bacterium]|nr:hypothetical protein [Calditrichia bacterium]